MRRVRILRRQPHRRAQQARTEIGLGERERVAMRIEDVGLKDLERVCRQLVRDPRHHPDTPPPVVGVDAAELIEVERHRVGGDDGEGSGGEDDERGLGRSARAHERRMVAWASAGADTLGPQTYEWPISAGFASLGRRLLCPAPRGASLKLAWIACSSSPIARSNRTSGFVGSAGTCSRKWRARSPASRRPRSSIAAVARARISSGCGSSAPRTGST